MKRQLTILAAVLALAAGGAHAAEVQGKAAGSAVKTEEKAAKYLKAEGTITALNFDAKTITVKTAEGIVSFILSDDIRIKGGAEGLSVGVKVKIKYEKNGSVNTAKKISIAKK